MHCHSLMELNKARDVSSADWRSQTRKKLSLFFTCEIRSFSVMEIPIKHSSLLNKVDFAVIVRVVV